MPSNCRRVLVFLTIVTFVFLSPQLARHLGHTACRCIPIRPPRRRHGRALRSSTCWPGRTRTRPSETRRRRR